MADFQPVMVRMRQFANQPVRPDDSPEIRTKKQTMT